MPAQQQAEADFQEALKIPKQHDGGLGYYKHIGSRLLDHIDQSSASMHQVIPIAKSSEMAFHYEDFGKGLQKAGAVYVQLAHELHGVKQSKDPPSGSASSSV